MELRPYQKEAVERVFEEWQKGNKKTLLNMATGTGKTIVFSKIVEERVRQGDRCLILAHREELLDQASDKLKQASGLVTCLEKAENSALGRPERVTVGSVQSLANDKRLERFPRDYYSTIVVDEAHHTLSKSYLKVLGHFDGAKVLGVTATPDRGDYRNLGEYYDSLAYEYNILDGIREGYLSPIKSLSVPLEIDLKGVSQAGGDYAAGEVAHAIDPYLEAIADEMVKYCKDKKTIVFLPLIETSKKFTKILQDRGFRAEEVNGQSKDRDQILERFSQGETNVLCNAMLATEGYDEPSIDCVVILRPTKVRSLYTQMVGRGLRLHPGKDHLLLLDFLWLTDHHNLVEPVSIFGADEETKAKAKGRSGDLMEILEEAERDVVTERESALAETLEKNRKKKKRLVDPLQYQFSIMDKNLADYVPSFGWEMEPPTDKQVEWLESRGLDPSTITSKGEAGKYIETLKARDQQGLATPKQIRMLERRGCMHVGEWTKEEASNIISRLAQNNWRFIPGIKLKGYAPERLRNEQEGYLDDKQRNANEKD